MANLLLRSRENKVAMENKAEGDDELLTPAQMREKITDGGDWSLQGCWRRRKELCAWNAQSMKARRSRSPGIEWRLGMSCVMFFVLAVWWTICLVVLIFGDPEPIGVQSSTPLWESLPSAVLVVMVVAFGFLLFALVIAPLVAPSLARFQVSAKSLLAITVLIAFTSNLKESFIPEVQPAVLAIGLSMIVGVLPPLGLWMVLDAVAEAIQRSGVRRRESLRAVTHDHLEQSLVREHEMRVLAIQQQEDGSTRQRASEKRAASAETLRQARRRGRVSGL